MYIKQHATEQLLGHQKNQRRNQKIPGHHENRNRAQQKSMRHSKSGLAKLGFLKDTIWKITRQGTEWEKIIYIHISDKGLVSRICKELLQLKKQPN